jgi:hypothetical protein
MHVEVDTRYLDTEPEQWEAATVYKIGGLLGDRNIEVEYAVGGVAPVSVRRVRPVENGTPIDRNGRTARFLSEAAAHIENRRHR